MSSQAQHKSSLAGELNNFKESWNVKAGEALVQTFENGIEELNTSGMVHRALAVGDKAPDFELDNALGKPVTFASLLKNGPVIISWYRGGWCPYCNIQLRYLQNFLPQFKEAGATFVGQLW